jgi:type IV secretory pathway TraG/TraD family ATPase VirD4
MSNCQLKLFYKSSDIETLKYVQELSGEELVSKIAKNGDETTIRQDREPFLNITRLRALPRQFVAILLSESLNAPKIVQTYPIPVEKRFDWKSENDKIVKISETKLQKNHNIFETNDEERPIKEENKTNFVIDENEFEEEDF